MANRAYLSVWCRGFAEEIQAERFEQFLSTVPFSESQPGFSDLLIRAVGPEENPVFESERRVVFPDAASVIEILREHVNADSAYEVRAYWDLWVFDMAKATWELRPEPMDLRCYGEQYDNGAWHEFGHLHGELGFEHLFTGHGRLLGFGDAASAPAQDAEEKRFLALMAAGDNFRLYHERTRHNISKLLDWSQRIERALPVERTRLWSEGEENFESRIEEILAVR
jgi:hypothetical protein